MSTSLQNPDRPASPSAAKPAAPAQVIRRRTPADPRLPSFSQQQLWFLDRLTPGTAAYNIPFSVRIRGALDVPAVEQTVAAVVQRHEVLRTVFATFHGRPIPVTMKNPKVTVQQIDLRDWPVATRETEAQRLLTEDAAKPFDLSRDPLLRTLLVRLADEEFLFLHVSHHIAWEYWSTLVWYDEFCRHYEAFHAGRVPELPELPVQFGDFALWQREFLQGSVLEELQNFWRQQLADAPQTLHLPADRPRPAIPTQRGARLPITLPPALLERVKSSSRELRATPFSILLAAFNVLLYCYSGQTDILVGSPIAHRPWNELKGLIGFFANTVVLRTKLADSATFRSLAIQAWKTTASAIANQALPFDRLVEAVCPQRHQNRMPLFQVNFRVLSVPPQQMNIEGLEISRPDFLDNGTAKFDLALELVTAPAPNGYGSFGFWQYSTDLFDEATIARMSAHLLELIAALLDEPDVPLAAIAAAIRIKTDLATRRRNLS